MKWLKFILSHSIFISLCAVALCYQTFTLLHLQSNNYYYGFVFFATLSSYNFYWLISKYSFSRLQPAAYFIRKNFSYLLLFFTAGFGMLFFLYFLADYFLYIGVGILCTVLYSLPLWPFKFVKFAQKAGFLKPVLLAFTWAFITVVVPAVPILHANLLPVSSLLIARFFFMLLLCIIFDMRDAKIDKIHALHTLATDVSLRSLQIIIYFVFGLYILAGLFVREYFHDSAQLVAFAATGLLVWIVYKLSLKSRGYLFYYFLVDGLMIISAIATYVAAI